MYRTISFFLGLIAFFAVFFQNCGPTFQIRSTHFSTESLTITEQMQAFEIATNSVFFGKRFITPPYNLEVEGKSYVLGIVYNDDESGVSPELNLHRLILTDIDQTTLISETFGNMWDKIDLSKGILILNDPENTQKLLVAANNDNRALHAFVIENENIDFLWSTALEQSFEDQDFEDLTRVKLEPSHSFFLSDKIITSIFHRNVKVENASVCEGEAGGMNHCMNLVEKCDVENKYGLKIFDGISFGACQPLRCLTGYIRKGEKCEPDIQEVKQCTIPNGIGEQFFLRGKNKGESCEVKSCHPGFHKEGDACVSSSRGCNVDNGMGQQVWMNNKWGSCQIQTCNRGYQIDKNNCIFSRPACNVRNGTGVKYLDKGDSSCNVISCRSGQHEEKGQCVLNQKNCSLSNGEGQQNWVNNRWGSCQVKSCDNGYRKENNKCLANKRECVLKDGNKNSGKGTQSWNNNNWGRCNLTNCFPGYHPDGNSCRANERSCLLTNGEGVKNWSFSKRKFSKCQVKRCFSGYKSHKGRVCLKNDAPKIQVRFSISKRSDGSGGGMYSNDFLRDTIYRMIDVSNGQVEFAIASISDYRNSSAYSETDCNTIYGPFKKYKEKGTINVLAVSGSKTCNGMAFVGSWAYWSPTMLAKPDNSRKDFESQVNHFAAVIFHELGHNMGMRHGKEKTVHIDNYYRLGGSMLKNYVEKIR